MIGPSWIATASFYLSCYGLAVASALLPWLNAEVLVLGLAAMTASPGSLAAVAVLATAGQVTGKSVMYWLARRASFAGSARLTARAEAWRLRIGKRPPHPFAWTLLSATVGVPPLYVVTLLAGLARFSFGRFLLAASLGRLVHFGALVLTAGLAP
jgi:membrane protein YqaA with SNARE-associated domain